MKNASYPPGRSPQRGQRGSILLLTLFYLMVLSFMAVAFWNLIPVELHTANRHKMDTQAYYVADAGVSDSVLFLRDRTRLGNVDTIFAGAPTDAAGNRVVTRTGELEGWTWTTEITPGRNTFGHAETTAPNPLRTYNIRSVASRGEQNFRRVSVWVVQRSFADFAWQFTDLPENPLWLNMQTFQLLGDYHTNDRLLLWNNFDVDWGGAPCFSGRVTFSTWSNHEGNAIDGIRYNSANAGRVPFDAFGVEIPGRYSRIAQGGASAIQYNPDGIDMPESTDSVAIGAYGDVLPATPFDPTTSFFGGEAGVNARFTIGSSGAIATSQPGEEAMHGLVIEGAVDQVEFSVVDANGNLIPEIGPDAPLGNQRVLIRQGTGASAGIVSLTHVTEQMVIPGGSIVNGDAIGGDQLLAGSDNGGTGVTVVERLDSLGNPLSPREFESYLGQSNGVIYATDDVRGVRGRVTGRRTLATRTDVGAGTANDARITINGEILVHSTVPGQQQTSIRDQIGLIGYAVRMSAVQHPDDTPPGINDVGMWPRRNQTNSTNPHNLYCSIFAGRQLVDSDPRRLSNFDGPGFGVDDSGSGSSLGVGTMHVYGSLNESTRQQKGTINTAGYNYQNFYDQNLRTAQPPFFPSRPGYDIATWEEESFFVY